MFPGWERCGSARPHHGQDPGGLAARPLAGAVGSAPSTSLLTNSASCEQVWLKVLSCTKCGAAAAPGEAAEGMTPLKKALSALLGL